MKRDSIGFMAPLQDYHCFAVQNLKNIELGWRCCRNLGILRLERTSVFVFFGCYNKRFSGPSLFAIAAKSLVFWFIQVNLVHYQREMDCNLLDSAIFHCKFAGNFLLTLKP